MYYGIKKNKRTCKAVSIYTFFTTNLRKKIISLQASVDWCLLTNGKENLLSESHEESPMILCDELTKLSPVVALNYEGNRAVKILRDSLLASVLPVPTE